MSMNPPKESSARPVQPVRPDRHPVRRGLQDHHPARKSSSTCSGCCTRSSLDLGVNDATIDDNGYVYGTVPSNLSAEARQDASPSSPSSPTPTRRPPSPVPDVKPIVHKNYQGGDIVLPGDPAQVIHAQRIPQPREALHRHGHRDQRRHHAARRRRQGRRGRDHDGGRPAPCATPRSRTAPSRSASPPTRRSAAAPTISTSRALRRRLRLHHGRRPARRDRVRDLQRVQRRADHQGRRRRTPVTPRTNSSTPSASSPTSSTASRATWSPRPREKREGYVHPYVVEGQSEPSR